jgi:hypothetical protein
MIGTNDGRDSNTTNTPDLINTLADMSSDEKQMYYPKGGIKMTCHKGETVYFDFQFDPSEHTSYEAWTAFIDQNVRLLSKGYRTMKLKDCVTLQGINTISNKITITVKCDYTFEIN